MPSTAQAANEHHRAVCRREHKQAGGQHDIGQHQHAAAAATSMMRPTAGPANAAISKAPENAPKTHDRGTPRPAPIGSARIAGR